MLLPCLHLSVVGGVGGRSSGGSGRAPCGPGLTAPALSPRKLHQSQLELQEVRLSCRQLQGKVEELTEERSLQSSAATSTSLLSEIEQSMEAEELEQEREQVLPPPAPPRHSGLWGSLVTQEGPDWEPRRPPAGRSLIGTLVH